MIFMGAFPNSIFSKNIDGMIAKFFELKSDISLQMWFYKELMKKKLKELKNDKRAMKL